MARRDEEEWGPPLPDVRLQTVPPSLLCQHPNGERERNDSKRLFDFIVYYLIPSSPPSGKFSGRPKLLKEWTQMSAFIDLSPPTEKIGQEIKSLTTSLVSGLSLLPSIE